MAEDVVDEIKGKVDIVSLLEESGYHFQKRHGRYLQCREHDSLVVDTVNNCYYWNSQGESGDVFSWVQARNKAMDFRGALELLARRANVALPERGEKNMAVRMATRAREDAFQVAQRVFAKWLLADEAALAYAKGRGWSDETIEKSGIGFSGRATAAELKEMGEEFAMHGVEPQSAAAVAITGFKGDVQAWKAKHVTEISLEDWDADWERWGFIPGMMFSKKPRLVYPCVYAGRVRTMTGRNLKAKGDALVGDDEPKSFNLPRALGGSRQFYFNWVYGGRAEELVIVEGPADMITLGQWGMPAVATTGTNWSDQTAMLAQLKDRHPTIYLATDADEAGQKVVSGKNGEFPLADVMGPMLRIVNWPEKDANDWLQAEQSAGVIPERQHLDLRMVLDGAEPIVVKMARNVGALKGAARDKALERTVKVIAKMPPLQISMKRKDLADAMQLQLREFNNLIGTEKKEKVEEGAEAALEITPTLGGWFPQDEGKKGYLIEHLWDLQTGKGSLAWRGPDGQVSSGPFLDLDGLRYVPVENDDIIRQGGVLFASELAPLKDTKELVTTIEFFLRRYFLLDNALEYKLAAYYVLLTWLFDCFSALPYLRAQGDTNTGKSELMMRIGYICYRLVISTGASSTAALKFALHMYRGTIFMDEMDLADKFDERMVILNVGAMKDQAKVWNMMPVIKPDGSQGYTGMISNVYGPKLITMYGRFKDPATEGRCITFKMSEREPQELKSAGIPTEKTKDFYEEAQHIRNLMLRWRLEHWEPQIELDQSLASMGVSTRINQVTMPIKWIAKNKSTDKQLLEDVEGFTQLMQDEALLQKSMGLDARVMDAVLAVLNEEGFTKYSVEADIEGYGRVNYIQYKDLAFVTNAIINEMNAGEAEQEAELDNSKKRKHKEITSHTIGNICRNDLRLPVKRMGRGFVVILVGERIELLKKKYGLERYVAPAPKPGLMERLAAKAEEQAAQLGLEEQEEE
jgi:hypothetical protein